MSEVGLAAISRRQVRSEPFTPPASLLTGFARIHSALVYRREDLVEGDLAVVIRVGSLAVEKRRVAEGNVHHREDFAATAGVLWQFVGPSRPAPQFRN